MCPCATIFSGSMRAHEYWGDVLTARAGMRTPEQTRDILARVAANFAISPGRD